MLLKPEPLSGNFNMYQQHKWASKRENLSSGSEYHRRTSFSDPKGSFGKFIKLLGNSLFLCIAHFRKGPEISLIK